MSSHQNSGSTTSTGGDTITAGTGGSSTSAVGLTVSTSTGDTITAGTGGSSTSAVGLIVSTSTVGGTSTSTANTSGSAGAIADPGSGVESHYDSDTHNDSDKSISAGSSNSDFDVDLDSDSDHDDGISLKKRSDLNIHSRVLDDGESLSDIVKSLLLGDLDTATKQETMNIVHNLAIERFETIEIVLKEGMVRLLVKLSADKHTPLQRLAVGCLTNIAAGRSEVTQLVVKKKAVHVLTELLNSRSNLLKSLAIRGLGNIAAGNGACRHAIFFSSAFPQLMTVFTDRDNHFKDVNGALLNLFRKKVPSSVPNPLIKNWIDCLLQYHVVMYLSPNDDLDIRSEDDKTGVKTSLQMLLCFVYTPSFYTCIEIDTYQHVPKYLKCKDLDITSKALEIVNHVPGDIKRVLVDNNVLTNLKLIMEADEHLSLPLLRKVCEAILMFTFDEPNYSQDVIGEEHLILSVLYIMNDISDPAIKLAAAKIIFNVTCVGLEHIMLLPWERCIEYLSTLFLDNDDEELLELSLGAIHNFLLDGQTDHNIETITELIDYENGAVDKLIALMNKDDSEISRLAEEILTKLKLE